MRYWLVMPAAGSASRFGGGTPKQYARLEGRSVIEWALAPFLNDGRCAEAVVALAAGDSRWPQIAARLPGAVTVAAGGAQRSLSVRSALAALEGRAAAADWVLVHDAARPCLESADLERLIGSLTAHRLGGLLATPAADTLKRAQRADPGGAGDSTANALSAELGAASELSAGTELTVAQTLDRAALWRALTPQMFRYGSLCAALDAAHAAGRFPTDEAQALEWRGEHPLLIEGAASNLKITTAADLLLAAAVLRARAAPENRRTLP